MPTPRKAARPAAARTAPAKRKLAAVEDDLDTDRMLAEVDAEEDAAEDGSVLIALETDRGAADIAVPPMGRWRSQARAALFSRGDDFTWATLTLSRADAQTWARLDPTKDDSDQFFADWGQATGERLGESDNSNRASRRSRRR